MAKNSSPKPEDATPKQERRYRLVNLMTQKLTVNTLIDGKQESLELEAKGKSRFFSTNEFGPHAEALRSAKRLMVESS